MTTQVANLELQVAVLEHLQFRKLKMQTLSHEEVLKIHKKGLITDAQLVQYLESLENPVPMRTMSVLKNHREPSEANIACYACLINDDVWYRENSLSRGETAQLLAVGFHDTTQIISASSGRA